MMLYRQALGKVTNASLIALLCIGVILLISITIQNVVDILEKSDKTSTDSKLLAVLYGNYRHFHFQ